MSVKLLLGMGVVAALVLTGGSWAALVHLAQVRGQSEAVAMARAEVEVARTGALDARLRLALARDEAVSELEGVRELLAVGTVWLDAEALAVVADRATRLARVVPQVAPPYIPGYETGSVESLAAWEARYLAMERLADERFVPLDRALGTLRDLVADTVRDASRASPGVVNGAALVPESQRDAARVALEGVAAAMRAGENPVSELTSYATVVTQTIAAQRDAEAAAAAAAAAASSGGGGGGGGGGSLGPGRLFQFPPAGARPTIVTNEYYVPFCEGYNGWTWIGPFAVPGGSTYTIDLTVDYSYVLLGGEIGWGLGIQPCV